MLIEKIPFEIVNLKQKILYSIGGTKIKAYSIQNVFDHTVFFSATNLLKTFYMVSYNIETRQIHHMFLKKLSTELKQNGFYIVQILDILIIFRECKALKTLKFSPSILRKTRNLKKYFSKIS